MNLARKIEDRTATVTVIGGGYVGLPLAVAIAKAGFSTEVYDTDVERVNAINLFKSHVADVTTRDLTDLRSRLHASRHADAIIGADIVVVCVPTPLNKTKDPDNSFVVTALDEIARYRLQNRPPQLVIIESTTFPGFTREVALPKLAAVAELDKDFWLAFSPERVDPGNKTFGIGNTPKVVGGVSEDSRFLAAAFYDTFVDNVITVSSTDTAEMVKLLENTFRAVNIGLVNEISIMCQKLGVNVWELIDAAATKPFGFMPFYPGPGLGGHCIPVDPLYLAWKLRTLKYDARFIGLADEVNSAMPSVVVQRVADALNKAKKAVNGSKVLLCGVAYKRDVSDVRESPAFDIADGLRERGAEVEFYDTHVGARALQLHGGAIPGITARISRYDCVVIVTDHSDVDYVDLCRRAQLVVDCRNATKSIRRQYPDKVITL